MLKILEWIYRICNNIVFQIVVAYFLVTTIYAIIVFIHKIFFVFIKHWAIKSFLCMGISAVSSFFCYRYSKLVLLIVLVDILMVFSLGKFEKKMLLKADDIKFSKSQKFESESSMSWASVLFFSLWGSVLLCLNKIVCDKYGLPEMGWFEFYWKFNEGIFRYNILRYIMGFFPWIALMGTFGLGFMHDEKNWIDDLEKKRQKEEREERAERARILEMNPDSDFEENNMVETRKLEVAEDSNPKVIEETDNTEEILDDISKFI